MYGARRPHGGGRFFFGGPFVGGLLGGLVGSALFYPRPRPFIYPYQPYPYYPYGGGFGPGFGAGYNPGYGPGFGPY